MDFFLQTCTPQPAQSKDYFVKLGFKIVDHENYFIAYDSQMKLLIGYDRKTRPGITLLKEDWSLELEAIKRHTRVVTKEEGYFFSDPSGSWYRLIEGPSLAVPNTTAACILGNFAGISLETLDIAQSLKLTTSLGFELSAGAIDKGWVSCTDQLGNTISLMTPFSCPHMFLNPSATFFNGKENTQIIANIRSLNISIMEEITAFDPKGQVDNVILREPGGYGFFIFND